MSDFIHHLLFPLVEHFKSYGAWIAFFAAFAETLIGLGLLIPGSTLLLVLGILAGQGYLDIKTILLFGFAGAYLGDITNYHLGRRYGNALLQKPWLHLSHERISQANRFIEHNGGKSIFLGRFVPGLKESLSFIAGSLKMRRSTFLAWDFLGAAGWSLEFIGIGYLFSASLALAQLWLSRTLTLVVLLLLSLFLIHLFRLFLVYNLPAIESIGRSLWHAFLHNEKVVAFARNHPKTVAWLRQRVDSSTFTGLPLTLFSLAMLYIFALLGGVVEDLLTKDPIVHADQIFAHLVVQWRNPEMTTFFTWVTYLGKSQILFAALMTLTLILYLNRKMNEIVALWFSFAGSILFVYLGKLAFHRPRPTTALYLETTYSFPSAHALVSISFYGFAAYLLMRECKNGKTRVFIFISTLILILLIGLSRLYLAEHYLSDVYGGYLLGLLWAVAAAALLLWLEQKRFFKPTHPPRLARPASLALVASFIAFFIYFGTHFSYPPSRNPAPSSVEISDPTAYFSNPENFRTRNILGFQSLPVSLVIDNAVSIDLCALLEKEGWRHLSKKRTIDFPLFWHYQQPDCTLYKEENGTIHLFKLWHTNLTYKTMPLEVGVVDAITGFRWSVVPIFTEDLPSERAYVAETLSKLLPNASLRTIIVSKPLIEKRFFEELWFFDGKITVITTGPKRRCQVPASGPASH